MVVSLGTSMSRGRTGRTAVSCAFEGQWRAVVVRHRKVPGDEIAVRAPAALTSSNRCAATLPSGEPPGWCAVSAATPGAARRGPRFGAPALGSRLLRCSAAMRSIAAS